MVSPSLTILGGPYLLPSTTFLPLGPRVTPTNRATKSTPAWSFLVAERSRLKCRSLYTGIGGGFFGEKGRVGGFMEIGGDGGAILDMLPPIWQEKVPVDKSGGG
uniref:Uncharacterized protein n=1 Tax=Arundo donax TaxID=35708 RepID=A0A0A9GGL2_ARUDO